MGIVHNTLASFVSRNNHVDGYWAIGKLHRLIKSSKQEVILVDLLKGTISPHDSEMELMVQRIRNRLFEDFERHNISTSVFARAEIEFRIDKSETMRKMKFPGQKFKKFTCGIALEDTDEIEYCDITYGWSFPHHPNMEKRSYFSEEE